MKTRPATLSLRLRPMTVLALMALAALGTPAAMAQSTGAGNGSGGGAMGGDGGRGGLNTAPWGPSALCNGRDCGLVPLPPPKPATGLQARQPPRRRT